MTTRQALNTSGLACAFLALNALTASCSRTPALPEAARADTTPEARETTVHRAPCDASVSELREALATLRQLPETSLTRRARRLLYEEWARRRPADALAFARDEEPSAREEQIDAILLRWLATDPAAAVSWPADAADFARAARHVGAAGASWAACLAERWASVDPAAATTWVARWPAAGEDVLCMIGTAWASRDPEQAARHALTLPGGLAREELLTTVMLCWLDRDLGAASAWVNGLKPSREIDRTVSAIATRPDVIQRDPLLATGWAESIVDSETRTQALRAIVQLWRWSDAAAADRYLQDTTALSAAQKQSIVARFEDHPRVAIE